VWHQRQAASRSATGDTPLPSWLNGLFVICGIGFTAAAIAIFLFPALIIPIFPWRLTPLTARSLSGWLIIVGTMMLSLSRENGWTRSRLVAPMLILLLPALLLQMSRYADEVKWSNPIVWISLFLFAVIGFCGLYLANGSWREALR
jgi:hypothetical protein